MKRHATLTLTLLYYATILGVCAGLFQRGCHAVSAHSQNTITSKTTKQ